MSGTPSQRREMEETPSNSISTSQSIDNNAQEKAAATITATANATSSAEIIMQPSHEVVATNTESVEVHVPGLTSPLHLTLPRTINQTTVKELRKMIIKQLRALDSDIASSNNPVGVSRVVNSNKNKVFFIRLMFRGKELQKDANTLASEHIKDGSAVHAMRTFVQPEYQRRQAAERKRQRAIQKNAIQQQTSHEQSEQRREEEEESSEEEEEEENDESNSSNSIRRNITSSLMPLSQQNLHEARQALATALSAFWPTNDPADENYNDISNSADHNLGNANTSVRDGADANSNRDNSVMSINANNNNNNNINLVNDDRSSVSTHSSADRRRVARSRLNNAELLRLIQAERVRSAQLNSYNQDLAPGLQIREPQSQQQQQQEQRSELLQTSLPNSSMTTGASFASSPAHERPFQLHQGGSSNIHTLANTTTNAPLATTSTTITTGGDGSVIDNSTVRSNDVGRVRMMELADGNNSNLRRGTTNAMRSTAFNNVNGSGGAGGNNRADDIEARIEAERQYFWKEFTVNFVIGLLLGPIGFIFPNDTLGKIAIILGMITNILCLMLTSTVNEYSWEIFEHRLTFSSNLEEK